MMSTSEQLDLIALGNDALARNAWAEARALFCAALDQAGTAEAHEGLSRAAWWQNDGSAAIRGHEAAYRLYRRSGDNLGAARMAMWLGSDYEDFRGELSISRGWRQRAFRLLEGVPPTPEHG